MRHELKTDPAPFDDVESGAKKFEIRYADRTYAVGDILVLRRTRFTGESMKRDGLPLEYTHTPPLTVRVTHILCGPIYGLAAGWVIMSIELETGNG